MSMLLEVTGVHIQPTDRVPGHFDPETQVWSSFSEVTRVEDALSLFLTGATTQSGGVNDDTST